MNKNIAIILSHCNSEKKTEILMENIAKLKTIDNLDILLTSHIILPEHIINICDYFMYDKSNPIIKLPIRSFSFWEEHISQGETIKLTYFSDDYVWTVFNQILMGYNSISHKSYDNYIFLNYDLIIDSKILEQIKEDNYENKFYNSEDLNGTVWFPSWVFFILNKDSVYKFVNSISYKKYLENGEKLFISAVNSIDYKKIDIKTKEQITFSDASSGKEFNNSLSPKYSLFVGYDGVEQNGEKNYYFYNIKEKMIIKYDDEKYITMCENDSYFVRVKYKIEIMVDEEFTMLEYNNFNNRIQIIQKINEE